VVWCIHAVPWPEDLVNGLEELLQECALRGGIALGKANKVINKYIDIGEWSAAGGFGSHAECGLTREFCVL